jgi:peptidoglycan-associated lipoprotein
MLGQIALPTPQIMKLADFSKLLLVALVIAVAGIGCKKVPKSPTPIPNAVRPLPPVNNRPSDMANVNPTPTFPPDTNPQPNPLPPADIEGKLPPAGHIDLANYNQDRDAFKQQTVYFDFDRYNVKASELPRLQTIADYLKANPSEGVLIEGNCDERGTPGYNMALGERRALSARESLVNLGSNPDRIYTISYGEDKPADPGHNEAAWAKNRRDDFVLLKPKTAAAAAPENR